MIQPAAMCPEGYMRARFSYADLRTKKLVRKLKFTHELHVIQTVARELSDLVLSITEELLEDPSVIRLVPLPSNPTRTKIRGYDQAVLLARAVEKELGIPIQYILERTGTRRAQTGLSRKERLENMHGAFRVAGTVPQIAILIDDVITTGATVREARKILLESGAKKVFAVSLAH